MVKVISLSALGVMPTDRALDGHVFERDVDEHGRLHTPLLNSVDYLCYPPLPASNYDDGEDVEEVDWD